MRVVVQSELVANEPLPDGDDDPRGCDAERRRCVRSSSGTASRRSPSLVHSTARAA